MAHQRNEEQMLVTSAATPPDPAPFGYCGGSSGWVAGASADEDPWLEPPKPPECPAPDIEGILGVIRIYRLICFGDEARPPFVSTMR